MYYGNTCKNCTAYLPCFNGKGVCESKEETPVKESRPACTMFRRKPSNNEEDEE